MHVDGLELERGGRSVIAITSFPCGRRPAPWPRAGCETVVDIHFSRPSEPSRRTPVTPVAQYGWTPLIVRPLEIVARTSAPTRTRGRLPRPPTSETPARATAVSAVKMMAGLADGLASVTEAAVTRPPSAAHAAADHEAEHAVPVAVDAGPAHGLGAAADRHQPDAVPGPGQEDRADEEQHGDDPDRRGHARGSAGSP